MLLNNQVNYKIRINFLFKVSLFVIVFLILPGLYRILDHNFQKYFGLNKYINVFDFIFFNFLAICFLKREKIKKYISVPLVLLVCYIILARISLIFSIGEIHYKAFYDLFKTFLVITLCCIFFTPFFKQNYQKIMKGFLVVFFTITLFESILGIMQFILQKPLGFSMLNEPSFGVNIKTSASIFISESKQFFFNKISNNSGNCFLRAHGTFFHPNILSGFLNISGILTLFLICTSRKKNIFSIFFVMQLIALIFTFSRAGFASFVCSSFLFFTAVCIKKYDVKKAFLLFLSCFLLIVAVFSKYLTERGFLGNIFQSKKANEMNVSSSNTRVALKNASINMIKKHPFCGVGFRNFLIKRDDYSSQKLERAYVHNIYLLIACETGILSLLVFMALIALVFISIIRYCLDLFNIALVCIIISFLLIGIFDHYPVSSYFGKLTMFSLLGFLNFSIKINKPASYFEKAFLCQ